MLPPLTTKANDQLNRPEVWAWAEREVARQGAPTLAPQFIQAWDYARNNFFVSDHLDLERQIRFVNMLVCGDRTVTAGAYPVRYRQTPAVFANGNEGANWQEIPRLMSQLCKSPLFWDFGEKGIEDFCIEFLRIHPFCDGNGRTASILLNRRTWKQDFISVPTVDGWIEDARV